MLALLLHEPQHLALLFFIWAAGVLLHCLDCSSRLLQGASLLACEMLQASVP